MRRSKANARRKATPARSHGSVLILAPILIVVAAFLVVLFLVHAAGNSATGAYRPEPTKPQGTRTDNPPTTEKWTLAKGLPSNVTRLAFSAVDASRRYAVAFVSYPSQAVY